MKRGRFGICFPQRIKYNADGVASRTLTADGQRIASEVEKTRMSWIELQREVESLSQLMITWPGIQRGDRLGLIGHNSVEYLQILLACGHVGIIFVPLNTRWSVDELRHAVQDCDIRVLAILSCDFLALASALSTDSSSPIVHRASWLLMPSRAFEPSRVTPGKLRWPSPWRILPAAGENPAESMNAANREGTHARYDPPTSGDDSVEDNVKSNEKLLGYGNDAVDADADADADDVFCIVHTSGSTGRSKGVALTCTSQIVQARAKCLHFGYTSSSVYLNVLPLFHVGGINTTLAITMAGGCHVFLPRFSASSSTAAVRVGRVNALALVPTMLHMLVEEEGGGVSSSRPFTRVESMVVGGQPLQESLEHRARRCFPRAAFVQTYACSEAGSTITFEIAPPSEYAEYERNRGQRSMLGTGGSPAAHVEIRVVEHGSGQTGAKGVRLADPDVVGEVETRGPHVMKGYWGRPDLTASVLRPDGWLRTGDLGRLDKLTGRLVIVGRTKDVIKTGGENVYAAEVESVLLRHDWVAEAAAYGMVDEKLGEKIAVSVVLDRTALLDNGDISTDKARATLRSFCRLHLSRYKRPQRIDIVPALPKNDAGKILRHRLCSCL